MSLRRSIINQEKKDPVLLKIIKSLRWQWNVVKNVKIPKQIKEGTAATIKQSKDGCVIYEDNKHVYFTRDERIPLISVTTILSAFKTPFDADLMSVRCANKEDYETNCLIKPPNWDTMSTNSRAELIKMAWKQNRDQAANYGTFIHACLEHCGRNPNMATLDVVTEMRSKFSSFMEPIEDLTVKAPNFVYYFKNFFYNPRFRHIGEILFEPVIYDLDIAAAGQSDLVILNHKKKKVHIVDYKTNRHKPGSENDEGREFLLPPLSHIEASDLNIYRLQVCLYQAFVVKATGYGYGKNWILWANRENGQIDEVEVSPNEEAINIRNIYQFMLKYKDVIYEQSQ